MKIYRTIPRTFKLPVVPKTVKPNDTLDNEFRQWYETLFFEHLDRIMTKDNIDPSRHYKQEQHNNQDSSSTLGKRKPGNQPLLERYWINT